MLSFISLTLSLSKCQNSGYERGPSHSNVKFKRMASFAKALRFSSVHFVVPAGKIGLLTGSEEIAHKKNNIKAQKNNAQLPQKDIILHLKERKNTKIYFF